MKAMTRVRTLRPDEWRLWQDLRLQALATSPEAFGDTLDRARSQSDSEWQEIVASSARPDRTFLVVERPGRAVGMARVYLADDDPSRAELFSMWVMPAERGTGAGRALVDAAIDWARSNGVSELTLHVTEGNEPATRLYEACGFVDTGDREPVRPGSGRWEKVMVLRL